MEIKRWDNNEVIYSGRFGSIRECLESAVKEIANLAGAYLKEVNLKEANLAGAYLKEVNLKEANLYGVNLKEVNLKEANLYGVNLYKANLAGANLAGANLAGANLAGANLAGANLAGANLAGANLYKANLAGANLAGVRGMIVGYYGDSHRLTVYSIENKTVNCGCFSGTLTEFEKAVIKKYSSLDKTDYKFFIDRCKWLNIEEVTE